MYHVDRCSLKITLCQNLILISHGSIVSCSLPEPEIYLLQYKTHLRLVWSVTINGLSGNSNSTVRVNRFEYFKNISVKIVAHIILR